jgi:predicted RND superfamily exporter protein
MSILVAMGMIPFIGWKIVVISILLPVIMIAVANDYGIHIIARYQEDNREGNNFTKQELAKRTYTGLSKPIFLAGLTTFAGMLCLLGHELVPARQVGILAGVGIVYALAASLFFIPAVLSILPKAKPVIYGEGSSKKKRVLERMLEYFGGLVSRKPRAIIAGSLLFTLISCAGIFLVIIDANPNNYFPQTHPLVVVSNMIDEHMGGMQSIVLLFKGDIKDPGVMQKIDDVEKKVGNIQDIGKTTSIARVVRMMSRALNDVRDPWYDTIPDERNAVAQYFELYSMSGDPEDFEKMVDFPYEHAVISARFTTESTPAMKKAAGKIEDMLKHDGEYQFMGGFGLILMQLADIVIRGQLISLAMAIIAVAVLIMLLFRSFAAGIISAIPLALSMGILFGMMGFLKIHLNIATAMLSSIMIGVGIDYTIHFLWRYREERQNGLSPVDGVRKTLTTTGRGIVFNALSVIIGFIVLLYSNFMPVKFFGFLVVMSIFACLVGALLLIPAMCIVLRPRFLEPKGSH